MRIPQFESVSPPPYPHLTKSFQGITIRLNVKLQNASVWLLIRRTTKLESESIYRRLILHREEIERQLPDTVWWDDRTAGQWDSLFLACRANGTAGLIDHTRWPEVYADLISTTLMLLGAVAPYLPPSRWTEQLPQRGA